MSQVNGSNQPKEGVSYPYMSNDPNSNVNNFKIIESTLRGKLYIEMLYMMDLLNLLYRG